MEKIQAMTVKATSALKQGLTFLCQQQREEGYFEGQLSSSTFPSCAYAWVQLAQGKTVESHLIEWFMANQNQGGAWGLDTANISNSEATLFVKLILEQIHQRTSDPRLEKVLESIPTHSLSLALIKLTYAAFNQFDWNELTVSEKALPLMKLVKQLAKIPMLRKWLKTPRHRLPPVALFNTSLFEELFIAEQHTLVPVFILIELNTTKRPDMIASLLQWLKSHVLSDGSWFRVNYITALSVLALIELQDKWQVDDDIPVMLEKALVWLGSTCNRDGGCREALNLNVWDTALSIITLTDVGTREGTANSEVHPFSQSLAAATGWLVAHQNSDGGWAFSGLSDSSLPSDADDTALATLALLRAAVSDADAAIQRGVAWLKCNQGTDGSWSTYQPGQGDVGCVSITAHAIEALLAYGENEDAIERGIRWLRREMHPDGYWDDLWLAKRTYGTAHAITAFVKVGMADIPEVARGVKWLEGTQNADGGWGEDMFGNRTASTVEQTAWSTYSLLLAMPDNRAAQRGIDFLCECQRQDGSWEESCVGIYWEIIGGYADPIYASVFPLLALNQYIQGTPLFTKQTERNVPSDAS